MKKLNKGFSLIELMVVIAIIAILAAIAIPMYSNYTKRAKIASELSKIGGVKIEVAEQYMNNGTVDEAKINTPTGVDVSPSGAITVTGGDIPSGSSLVMTPDFTDSSVVTWDCTATGAGLNQSTVPSSCTYSATTESSGSSQGSFGSI